MLTETLSDPRRANWLTLSSMSEDICWPEENNNSRPTWELEAEILRLTTRLMMRETELKQAKDQLKVHTTKTQQQVRNFERKLNEKEAQMEKLLLQKDEEMQGIMSQLLMFEAELRQEQTRIEGILNEKQILLENQTVEILQQKKEIERLTNLVNSQTHNKKDDKAHHNDISIVAEDNGQIIHNGLLEHRQAEAIGVKQTILRRHSDTKQGSTIEFPLGEGNKTRYSANRDAQSKTDIIVKDKLNNHLIYKRPVDRKRFSNAWSDSIVFCDELTSSFDSRDVTDRINIYNSPVDKVPVETNSVHAVRKLKDGVIKIRAIQDVTNVHSLDIRSDSIVIEKKRTQYKTPQKMKDLKAKRINPHKIYRPVNEICAQAIL